MKSFKRLTLVNIILVTFLVILTGCAGTSNSAEKQPPYVTNNGINNEGIKKVAQPPPGNNYGINDEGIKKVVQSPTPADYLNPMEWVGEAHNAAVRYVIGKFKIEKNVKNIDQKGKLDKAAIETLVKNI